MDNFTAREIGKKYNHTIAQIKLKGSKEFKTVWFDSFFIADSGEHSCSVHIIMPSSKYSKKDLLLGRVSVGGDILKLKDFDILPSPDKCVFDVGGRTIVYARHPTRQWRKGLCDDNARYQDKMMEWFSYLPPSNSINLTLPHTRWDIKTLYNLFSNNYAGYLQEAISNIDQYELLSRAISEVYWIGLFTSEEKPYIFYRYDLPIAYYNNKSDTFTLVDKIYLQEITDFCNRFNTPSKIEV